MTNVNHNKKAAMFGLDARIALAIFGALSVITGASLFSAIQKAKTTTIINYFAEVVKASEEFYLTTGDYIPMASSSIIRITALTNGPINYLSTENEFTTSILLKNSFTRSVHKDIYTIGFLLQGSAWSTNLDTCVIGSPDCYEWIGFRSSTISGGAHIEKIAPILDEAVDGGDGPSLGNLRYTYGSPYVLYKGLPRMSN